jgi:hypothetical protein
MAYNGQQSGDVHATLALSQFEAMNGTSRTLTLPGGRQVVVPIPAGTREGQEIRLEGQGQPSAYGSRGALILTVTFAPAENYGSQSFPNAGTDFPTELVQAPPPPPPASSLPDYPSINQNGVFTNYSSTEQRPLYSDPTAPSYAQSQSPQYAAPQSYPQLQPQPVLPGVPTRRRGPSPLIITLVIVLALVLIGGGSLLAYTTVIQPNQIHAQATATAVSQLTSTAQTNATANAQTTGTAVAQANATATVIAQGTQQANATATALQNIYTSATSGAPILNDPLTQQDNNNWEVDSKNGGGGCAFTGEAYHATMPQTGFFAPCYAQSSNFSNFAFQVQMNIITGDRGGVIFRADSVNYKLYLFRIAQDGSYNLFLYVDNNGSHARSLLQGNSPLIRTGRNQNNTLTVIARNASIYFYVNQQYLASISDNTYSSGAIGVFGDDQSNPTDVAFTNLKVWTL